MPRRARSLSSSASLSRSPARHRDSSPDFRSTKRSRQGRHYRSRGERSSRVQLDPATIAKLDAEVEEKVCAALESEEVQKRIEARLKEERAEMERTLEARIAEERAAQLARKRREQEQRLQDQAELERILEENAIKLARAREAAEGGGAAPEVAVAEKIQSLVSRPTHEGTGHGRGGGGQPGTVEDIIMLGKAA